MPDWNAMADGEFRQMIADFVATSCPKRLLHRRGKIPWAEGKEWHVILWKAGMIAPAWPVEHGGMADRTQPSAADLRHLAATPQTSARVT